MLEADISVVRTIISRPLERLVRIKRKCWENGQYSRRDTLKTVSIRNLVDKSLRTICPWGNSAWWFQKTCTWNWHTGCSTLLKHEVQAFVKRKYLFSKSLGWRNNLNPMIRQSWTFLRTPKNNFNEGLGPYYRGIWNEYKKLWTIQKIHQFYKISDFIRVELEKIGTLK